MEYIKIGVVVKPHGINGEVKVLPLTDDKGRFKDLKIVYILNNDVYSREEITSVKNLNELVILKLNKFNKIEDSEILRNRYLFVEREDAVSLSEDEYYTQDLIGCEFYYENERLGKVIDVVNEGSCDIFVIDYKGNEVLYPFLKDMVTSVDIKNKKIIINQFEGYFD
jgi:16S rRNA processing protein RimM